MSLAEAEQLLEQRALPEALAIFDAAEAAGADANRCSAGRWTAHMLLGNFEAAWRQSDAIHARTPDDAARLWRGEPINGRRVMLRCLHGFGDAVQFLRYAPILAARASHLTVEVAPRFVELARCLRCVDKVITWGDAAPVETPAWDVQVEVMELPYLFRTQLADLPGETAYLDLPQRPCVKRGQPLQVGLAWTAGHWNPTRSLTYEQMEPLLAVSGCEFWGLERELPEDVSRLMIDEVAAQSLMGLARRIAALDLVITVDTVVAHLAGALGVQAWVMLQYAADWRWMHARDDSPWYPTLRLFRQSAPGDWGSVLASVRHSLSDEIRGRA